MAIIKKFRIKSFKNINTIIEFENVSLAYGNRLILDNINFKINEVKYLVCLVQMELGNQQYLIITGLLNPQGGKIKIAGEDATQYPIFEDQKI